MWLPAILLAALVSLAPLALGSNRPLPWAYNAVGAGLCLLATLGAMQLGAARRTPRWGPVRLPLALTIAVLIWASVQIVPLGLEGLAHPNWSYAGALVGAAPAGTISVNPNLTLNAATRLTTYIAVFLAAYLLSQDRRIARFLVGALIVACAVYAVYGLARLSFSLDRLVWFEQSAGSHLTASFINRNNAATYLGLGSLSAFALLQRELRHSLLPEKATSWRMRVRQLATRLGGSLGAALFLFVVVFCGLLATGSRAGIVFTAIAICVLILLQLLRSRRGRHAPRAAGPMRFGYALALLAVVIGLMEVAGARLGERLTAEGAVSQGRFIAYADTLGAIADNPLLGTGYGTFEDVYPLYRSAEQGARIWDKAHSDYLELFLGLGIPAALMFLAALGALFAACVRGAFQRRRDAHFAMIAVAASILVGLHALLDFSLQIEAVAMTFAVLLGVGTAQSMSSRGKY